MMKKFFKTVAMAIAAVAMMTGLASCNNDDLGQAPESVRTRATVTIPHNTVISANTTWSSTNEYILNGKVYVDAPATLTIEPGTVIKGAYNADSLLASALVITRGAKINASGTATNPIVFTAQNGQIGGWGGLVLLGSAPINRADQVIEGINPNSVPSGIDVYYGGGGAGLGDSLDNSGVLQYVRVEFAGAAIAEANELNAFTFGGVGKGTTLDHLQAYYGDDDSFEFFGGNVNAKYLVSTSPNDDNFDFDFGYTGKIQFAVATADPNAAYSSDPNGIECDNDGSGSGATPFTHPVLSNLTIVGTSNGQIAEGGDSNNPGYLLAGARFRRNTQYTLVNSIAYGYPTAIWNNTSNSHRFQYNVVWGVTTAYLDFPVGEPDSTNNAVANASSIILTSPFGDYYNSNALKPTGNPALTGANFTGLDMSFFTTTTYKGAIATGVANAWIRDPWVNKNFPL